MVMRADVLARAIDAAAHEADTRPRLLMSPRGLPLTQERVQALARGPGVLIVCGRFEGVDERVIEARALEEVSLGDFVLAGGELAAMALIDACVRLLPGVMGKEASGAEESFAQGLLEYPHYTRPQLFEGRAIPPVLLSGDHAKIEAWRRGESEALTRARRPDLWAAHLAKRHGVDPARHAVIVADRDGVIRLWSAGAVRLTGFTETEAVGQSLEFLVPERHRAAHWAGFRAAIAAGRLGEGEAAAQIPVRCRDGSERHLPGRFHLLTDALGAVYGVAAVFVAEADPAAGAAALPRLD
jgi:tRNA (guanine37-N1)-methyltransferase